MHARALPPAHAWLAAAGLCTRPHPRTHAWGERRLAPELRLLPTRARPWCPKPKRKDYGCCQPGQAYVWKRPSKCKHKARDIPVLPQDARKDLETDIQKLTDSYCKRADDMCKAKGEELMKV